MCFSGFSLCLTVYKSQVIVLTIVCILYKLHLKQLKCKQKIKKKWRELNSFEKKCPEMNSYPTKLEEIFQVYD
jgi:hypothetical protein